MAVGQDHRLADDQVERRAALALADANGLVAARFTHAVGTVAVQPEVVVRPVEVLGLAAHHFALRFEVLGQPEGEGQFGREAVLGHRLAGQRGHRDDLVELVVAQVGGDRHALDPGLGAEHCQRRFVVADVQADRRAIAAFGQGVALHHLVGQHRDLVARHVDRGQALAGELVDRRIGPEGQRRRGNVHAKDHGAGLQAVDRQRIVDLGGLRVVDRERLHWGQRQLVLDRRCGQHRETRALGELLEQKALPVKLVRRRDRACGLQQVQRRALGALGRLDHRLVLGAILVGLEQDAVELLSHRVRAAASRQLSGPVLDLQGLRGLALYPQQRGFHGLFGRFLEQAFAGAPKIMWRIEQLEQHGGLLFGPGLG